MDLSLKGKTILVTGATGGIGMRTAEALAGMAARVFVTGRSRDSAEAAVARLQARTGNDRIAFLLADLSTQAGVRSLARQFTAVSDSLHVLVNNAGHAAQARQLTEDGVEPFLLTHLLVEPLANAQGARVVSLTGGSHPRRIDLDNLQAEQSFAGLVTYSHAKVAMMAVMYEYAHRLVLPGITINVCY